MATVVPMTSDRFTAMNKIDIEAWSNWASKKFGRAIQFPTKQPVYGTYLDGDPQGSFIALDESGQRISPRTIQSSIDRGWAEPWFANPTKPDWLVCKITELGREAVRRR